MTALDAAEEAEDWLPRNKRFAPQIDGLIPTDRSREFDEEEMGKFFAAYAEGGGVDCSTEVGLAMGWSPAMIKRFVSNPERAELLAAIREAGFESLERDFIRHAHAGNSTAMKMVAYNLMAHRGWADRRQFSVSSESRVEVVLSVSEALDAKTRALVADNGTQGVAALQAAFLDDDDIVEGEVVE